MVVGFTAGLLRVFMKGVSFNTEGVYKESYSRL